MGGGAQVRLWIGNAQRHLRVPLRFGNDRCGARATAVAARPVDEGVRNAVLL
ncbi:hypothetical protein C4K20_3960 [Pseudomonas chlororaphis subsp. aurantiaca]|nr:hypothetical protein C4K20_3960 [Pseudomonas chlororaphis subsp. aurantiaca]